MASTQKPKATAPTKDLKIALETAAEVEEQKPEKKVYVLHAIVIDKFNTLRERRLLTPCTCDECGFDVALDNDEAPYDEHDAETQTILREALAKHKKKVHDVAQKLLVEEDKIPTAWMGDKPSGSTATRRRARRNRKK
jgi:hypothetical protein